VQSANPNDRNNSNNIKRILNQDIFSSNKSSPKDNDKDNSILNISALPSIQKPTSQYVQNQKIFNMFNNGIGKKNNTPNQNILNINEQIKVNTPITAVKRPVSPSPINNKNQIKVRKINLYPIKQEKDAYNFEIKNNYILSLENPNIPINNINNVSPNAFSGNKKKNYPRVVTPINGNKILVNNERIIIRGMKV
jgi:hypothetical protein